MQTYNQLLKPKSIAVIGASRDSSKLGYQILKNIVEANFYGKVYPINPKADKILGLHAYPSISDTIKTRLKNHPPQPIDLCLIVTPAPTVPALIKECHVAGVKRVIVITAGFAETGNHSLQQELEQTIKDINLAQQLSTESLRILGPNCLGVLSTHHNLNATFGPPLPDKGKLMLVSQSGALVTGVLDWLKSKNLGLSHAVSLGNRIDLSENEALEFAATDPNTDVILVYLESFKDAPEFFSLASKITPDKPIILLKGGQTSQGQHASASHTAALASDYKLLEAFCRQTGVILADNTEQWLQSAALFVSTPELKGPDIGIITNAGGPGVMATDQAANHNLNIKPLTKETVNQLHKSISNIAPHNPLDILGDALPEDFASSLRILSKDQIQDALIIIVTPQTTTQPKKVAQHIVDEARKSTKPIFVVLLGGEQLEPARRILEKHQIPVFTYPSEAIDLIATKAHYDLNRHSIYQYPAKLNNLPGPHVSLSRPITLRQAFSLLKHHDFKLPRWKIINHKSDIPESLNQVGRPAVLKTTAMELTHKATHGGVALGIMTNQHARMEFLKISKLAPEVLVQQTIHGQLEIILGAKRDPVFGTFLVIGLGGSLTNTLDDRSYVFIPATKTDLARSLENTKAGQAIKTMNLNSEVIIDYMQNLTNLMHQHPEIQELEINPLILTKSTAYTCDIKITS